MAIYSIISIKRSASGDWAVLEGMRIFARWLTWKQADRIAKQLVANVPYEDIEIPTPADAPGGDSESEAHDG
jgi:hypothetical protein